MTSWLLSTSGQRGVRPAVCSRPLWRRLPQSARINMDDAQDIAEEYGVMSIPALLYFKGGELINDSIGLISKERILSLLSE